MKSINWKNLSKWVTGGLLICGIAIPIPLLILNASIGQNNFVLGNYQSYMSPSVMQNLSSDYGLSFDYFETAENAKRLLKRNTTDISNTTSYELENWIAEGLVKKIDWTQLIGKSRDEVLEWFTEPVKEILNKKVNQNEILLDYGVPYFLQDLVFVYRGQEINELALNTPDWSTVLDTLSTEERFKPDKLPNIMALGDQRSIYSVPRLIETSNNDLNPQTDASIEQITETYTYLSDKLNVIGNNSITFNSDSNAVLNKIAMSEVNAAIMFNGDAIYAANGGDDSASIEQNDFHCIKPNGTLVALDLMVINNQIDDIKLTKAYEVIKQLCLNNGEKNFNEESLTFQNFDFVNYTPPLKEIYDYAIKEENGYFDGLLKNTLIETLKIEGDVKKRIESPIDDLTKSNFSFAWIGFKNRLK